MKASSSTSSSKSFVFGIAIGLLGLLTTFFVGSELLVRRFVLPVDDFHAHISLIEAARHPVIALGDSRFMLGIFGSKTVGNLGYPSSTVEDLAGKFDVYRKNRVPEIVILQANPYLLNLTRNLPNGDPLVPFNDLYKGPAFFCAIAPSYRPRLIDYWKRLILREVIGRDFAAKTETNREGGKFRDGAIVSSDLNFEENLSAELKQIELSTNLSHGNGAKLYRSLVVDIENGGSQVVLVVPPISRHMREGLNQMPEYQEGRKFFQDLAEKSNIPLLDYSGFFDQDEYFWDHLHLNRTGNRIFSDRLLNDMESLGFVTSNGS